MSGAWRFLWVSTRGYRLSPWRSPYLRWRIETYSGLHAESIGFLDFWRFLWRERSHLVRFLRWVDEMKKPLPNGRGSIADSARGPAEC